MASQQWQDIKNLVDVAVQRGLFRTAEDVEKINASCNYFRALEGEHAEYVRMDIENQKRQKNVPGLPNTEYFAEGHPK
jgi:adenine-specific DNA methylase